MKIKKNVNLKNKVTFRIGGICSYFAEPENVLDYIKAVEFGKEKNLKVIILGGGANILFPDYKLNALVISTCKLNHFTIDDTTATIGAGFNVNKAIKKLINHQLSGMEFAGGLPGSIGGAVYMNARCYGNEFADILQSVTVIDKNYDVRVLTKEQIQYGYKTSIFMTESDLFIIEAVFTLKKCPKKDIVTVYTKNYQDRIVKGQFKYPSAGCVFKNDYSVGISSGKLIDDSGLKGKSIGGAEVYVNHANFIINRKNARYSDVINLINTVVKEVELKKGVILEKELRVIE